jgi:hypothetical protein
LEQVVQEFLLLMETLVVHQFMEWLWQVVVAVEQEFQMLLLEY